MKTTIRRAVLLLLVTVLIAPAAVSGQEAAAPVKLTPYAGNPVLTANPAFSYEGGVGFPRVFYQDGQYHMLYMGYSKYWRTGSVNYATSTDGLEWTKYANNPVFVPDETFAKYGVMQFAVLPDGEQWLMYFVPWVEPNNWDDMFSSIYLATAPELTGPWTVAPEPVMDAGSPLDWDFNGRWIWSVLKANDAFEMYFSDSMDTFVGRATSPDGITWTKYDDPATTTGFYKNSDPVFSYKSADTDGWDRYWSAIPVVQWRDGGYEMFYTGADITWVNSHLGYATSPDGIVWTRVGEEPLLRADKRAIEAFWPTSAVEANGHEYLYYTIAKTGSPKEIAVATIERQ